ncbi:Mus7/MMS22 family-domain-containing protein [Xylaria cf. heliscus]|nr:Mus7/MMS22 family-domain-containing protein [Xylaria cf. heliscus]
MATWKELGEVPDSDDESTWDSQESQSLSLPNLPNLLVPASARADASTAADPAGGAVGSESQAIWDIPSSSQVPIEERNLCPSPKPHEPEPEPEPLPQPPTPRPSINESRRESTSPLSSLLELGHGTKGSIPIHSPIGLGRVGAEEPALSSSPDDHQQFVRSAFELQQAPVAQEDERSGNENGGLGRSLRPRKPIQEHPYLLESVQYSKTWKSHGLRPVRVLAEEQQKQRQEEDSQEQDFEDDSQVTSKDLAQDESEESQTTGLFDTYPGIEDVLLSDDGGPTPTPEPRFSKSEQAIQSSQEDEEFPDPNDVEKWKANRTSPRKRRSSPKTSSRRKRPKLAESVQATKDTPVLPDIDDIFDIPASPPQTSPGVLETTPMAIVNRLGGKPLVTLTPKPSSNMSSRVHSPAPVHRRGELIDLTALENGDSEDDSDVASSHTTSESEPDPVRLGARRIRGVLPASWLRLDQQTSMQKSNPTVRHRSPDLSPDRSGRKGVAQRRLASPGVGGGSALFLLDDSDDSDSAVRLHQPDMSFRDIGSPIVEDDAVSIIEEDHIDRMFSRRKRTDTSSSGPPRKRKRGRQSIFDGQPGQRKRQQRITGLLGGTKSTSSTPTRHAGVSKRAERLEKQNSGKRQPTTTQPPRLSILDVAEPNAPAFIRIAARTASRRRDRGRSSPSKKAIMLGTRQDTIDAVGVLKRWSEGMIQPRDLVSQPIRTQPRIDEVVKSTTQPHAIQSPRIRKKQASRVTSSTRFSQPRRMVKQASMDSFVDIGIRAQPELGLSAYNSPVERSRPHDLSSRPAQLEMVGDAANRYTFDARKRALDSLYRRSRKSLPTTRSLRIEQSISGQAIVHNHQHTPEALESTENNRASKPAANKRRARFRKQAHPQSVDVSAPQYTHANDPLPRELSPPTVGLDISTRETNGKLLGLGPYGTHYTQNFEIFPLDRGVYFHESTLLGSGRLKRAVDSKSLGNLGAHRGRCTFTIDEQTLHWGPWDARTSSELGIIFDWMMDRLDAPSVDSELGTTTPVQAAEFVLVYLQDHLLFAEPESSNIFASRLVDVLQAVERRFKELSSDLRHTMQSFVEVLTRILLITVQGLRLCEKLNKVSEAFQMEEILKRLATTTAKILLQRDLKEVRDIYDRLQQMSFREKGIRNDEYCIICWVSLVRILEEVRLPRAGFWGVISSTIIGLGTEGTFDATVLEQAWRTLFTLLPLGEFDSTGVAIPGIRRTAPLEGWMIPQRLLVRVFHLYQSNDRQSPSFNDYLRATVSRCHYLVEQWGWYKCNAILGTIFDFFAAQDLHNLRNEEVYQSPQFLEELSESPTLATTPEDRCFHIYLKLIAMSIKRLKKAGMTKEIKNLVARLLPNHSRQYDKMIATHEAEIAALRNHHDLLCTLYWAAPSDMRPSIQSIEGLVVLGSSHKEACLINLRAWSRLSRFVVSSCEDISAYRPLADWQRNISQQVLEQFLSVEAEVNQQLLGMSVEASKNITEQHKNAVISRNKKVAMDLLHFSMKAFLDVMRHTRTLGSASFVLNHYPLEQILTRLSFSSKNSDWGILQVILDIISYFLTRIDEFASAEPLHVGQSWHEEDAIMLLERKFASPLMSVVRGVVNMKSWGVGVRQVGDRDLCVEQAVILAGHLGACLVNARLARLRQFFQAGKYNIFPDISKPTVSATQRYLALFLATLADKGVADFKDLGLTSLDLYLAEIVKPFEHLAYENRLAMSFKRLGEAYIQDAIIEVGNTPDYSSNRALFDYTIVSMRKALLRADMGQKPHLQQIFSRALRFVMDRMKADLKSMALSSPEHLNHVEFVRSIISLIRSQDLCPVDSFFYQISQEYSPSRQDPRLQTAGILSWGLKLEEGDSKAVSGLFYLLFPSFKIALANGEIGNEANILKESMKHGHVFNFVLSTMLPAIIRAIAQVPDGWVLLDTYIEAIDARLSAPCIHQDIGENIMTDILALHTIVLAGVSTLRARMSPGLRYQDLVTLTAMIKILNLLSPSVTAHLINNPRAPIVNDFNRVMDELTDFTRIADVYLSDLVVSYDEEKPTIPEASNLFDGLGITEPEIALQCNEQMDRFSSHMIQDIRNNWISNEDSITIKGPSRPQRPSATQTGQGTRLPKWNRRELLQNLREQTRTWNYAHDTMMRRASHEALLDEFLF